MTQPKWTQDEAIAFESARECITDLMAIYSGQIADEEAAAAPDAERLTILENRLTQLARERAALTVADHAQIEMVRKQYGAEVRTYREKQQLRAA